MGADWLSEALAALHIRETRTNTLLELRTQLMELPSLEQVIAQRLLNAPELYNVLSDNVNAESDNIATDIISMCLNQLSMLSAGDILKKLIQNPRLRGLALNAIVKELNCSYSEYAQAPHISDDLVKLMLEMLQEQETAHGMPAVHVLTFAMLQRMERPELAAELQPYLQLNETIRLRVYELAVNVASVSPAALTSVRWFLEKLLNDLFDEDVLVSLNVLELVAKLSALPHGYTFLEEHGVVNMLSQRVSVIDQNPMYQLMVPGIMKFFGTVANQKPEIIIVNYPHLMHCFFDCMHSADVLLLGTVFDTFANVASGKGGKQLLTEYYGSQIKDVLENFDNQLRNISSDLKKRAFEALQIVFTYDVADREISRVWFQHLSHGSNNMQFLMDYLRNPFPDIKISALGLVRQLCYYGWGIEALRNTAGLLEYLLDRKLEFDKESKYAKYEVIKLLDQSIAFDATMQQQLHIYVNQGPYYVEPALDIATESGGNSN